jgi:exopolyphosphatase/pppGpp-phosphohydrolase
VAGLAAAAEVTTHLEGRAVVVSAYGIREGLLLEAAGVAAPGGVSTRPV